MGERKVLNKYFPPDFDPSKLPKRKRTVDNIMKVRMMMAMSVRCETCGIFISKGTKFNMRKEDVLGEDYLGIYIYRFYFRCPQCSSEITFKTDPRNSDYLVEHGAHRTAEPLKKKAVKISARTADCKQDEINSFTKALSYDADGLKNERNDLVHLENLRSERSFYQQIDTNSIINKIQENKMKEDLISECEELNDIKEKQLNCHNFPNSKNLVNLRGSNFDRECDEKMDVKNNCNNITTNGSKLIFGKSEKMGVKIVKKRK